MGFYSTKLSKIKQTMPLQIGRVGGLSRRAIRFKNDSVLNLTTIQAANVLQSKTNGLLNDIQKTSTFQKAAKAFNLARPYLLYATSMFAMAPVAMVVANGNGEEMIEVDFEKTVDFMIKDPLGLHGKQCEKISGSADKCFNEYGVKTILQARANTADARNIYELLSLNEDPILKGNIVTVQFSGPLLIKKMNEKGSKKSQEEIDLEVSELRKKCTGYIADAFGYKYDEGVYVSGKRTYEEAAIPEKGKKVKAPQIEEAMEAEDIIKKKDVVLLADGIASTGIYIGEAYLVQTKGSPTIESTFENEALSVNIEKELELLRNARTDLIEKYERLIERLPDDKRSKTAKENLKLLLNSFLPGITKRISELIKKGHNFKGACDYILKIEPEFDKLRTADQELNRKVWKEIEDLINNLWKEVYGLSEELEDVSGKIAVVRNLSTPQCARIGFAGGAGAFVDYEGGINFHPSLMLRNKGIPMVVGLKDPSNEIRHGVLLIVDATGRSPKVIVNPSKETIRYYKNKKAEFEKLKEVGRKRAPGKKDGALKIKLYANIDYPEEIDDAKKLGAEAIGLVRVENSYMNITRISGNQRIFEKRKVRPSPEDQHFILGNFFDALNKAKLTGTFRVVEQREDKYMDYLPAVDESSPDFGLGLWTSKKQMSFYSLCRECIESILIGGANSQSMINILFPYVVNSSDFQTAKEMTFEVQSLLKRRGISFKEVRIGAMIEHFNCLYAEGADFEAIGTNDFFPNMLRVPRYDETQFRPAIDVHNPAAVEKLQDAIELAHKNGIEIGICGNNAADPINSVILAAMGMDYLSVPPTNIPIIRRVLNAVTMSDAQSIYKEYTAIRTAEERIRFLYNVFNEKIEKGSWKSLKDLKPFYFEMPDILKKQLGI